MHTRKRFLIYPPNYKPGDGFEVRYSKRQAWKVVAKMGEGAAIDEWVRVHPRRGADWISSFCNRVWEFIEESGGRQKIN